MSSTSEARPEPGPDEDAGTGPVAADRPVVDGTVTSSEELRAEVDRLDDPDRQRVEELRAEVAATVDELSARLDVPARARAGGARAVAELRTAGSAAWDRPVVLAVAGVAALLLVVMRLRRRSGR